MSSVPDLSLMRVGVIFGDGLAAQHLDTAFLERLHRVLADVGLEHREELRAGLHEDQAGLLMRQAADSRP